jgi:hypothetical protein
MNEMPVPRETIGKSVAKGVFTAAAVAAAFWAVRQWIGYRQSHGQRPREETESWENEGGALAPHPAGLETSQVPR